MTHELKVIVSGCREPENKDIIDEFVLSDFKEMDEEKTEIVNSWKKAIHGKFIVDRHMKKALF